MPPRTCQPLFETTRGETIESRHYGALAVVTPDGRLHASIGDPDLIAFTRSTAKPFQTIPFVAAGGPAHYQLEPDELALICASHSGTVAHIDVVERLQAKTGVAPDQLQCGLHPPYDKAARAELRTQGLEPSSNHHDCSGKHTGMLAFSRMQGWPLDSYLEADHPLQVAILAALSTLTRLPEDSIPLGVDGCSAPNFALPLYNLALAYARLADPQGKPPEFDPPLREIVAAMIAHPEMVSGPGRFDTALMQAYPGRVIAKGGAEGMLAAALLPGATGADSPALGLALKISDGDPNNRARPAVMLEVLRQLGLPPADDPESLAAFGPSIAIKNWRDITIGEGRPSFTLQVG